MQFVVIPFHFFQIALGDFHIHDMLVAASLKCVIY